MNDHITEEPFDADLEPPSKSQRKREADQVLEFARELTDLAPQDLDSIGLTDAIASAVSEQRRIRSGSGARSAGKRQLHYLAKLLRKDEDRLPEWREACAQVKLPKQQEVESFHAVERWRERLLDSGSGKRQQALTDFKDANPQADVQQLRQMLRNFDKQNSDSGRTRLAREIFRWLREAVA